MYPYYSNVFLNYTAIREQIDKKPNKTKKYTDDNIIEGAGEKFYISPRKFFGPLAFENVGFLSKELKKNKSNENVEGNYKYQ